VISTGIFPSSPFHLRYKHHVCYRKFLGFVCVRMVVAGIIVSLLLLLLLLNLSLFIHLAGNFITSFHVLVLVVVIVVIISITITVNIIIYMCIYTIHWLRGSVLWMHDKVMIYGILGLTFILRVTDSKTLPPPNSLRLWLNTCHDPQFLSQCK
jgi:hypothetical protein